MDLTSHTYFEAPPLFTSQGVKRRNRSINTFLNFLVLTGTYQRFLFFLFLISWFQEAPLEGSHGFCRRNKVDTFPDPLCKLNLRETSEFVKAFPTSNNVNGPESRGGFLEVSAPPTQRRREVSAPPTPGRPIFSFSVGNNLSSTSRKNFPSKWDDAEKWLINGLDSPAHHQGLKLPDPSKLSKPCNGYKPTQFFAEKSRVTEEKKVSKVISSFQVHHDSVRAFNASPASADVLLKGTKQEPFLHSSVFTPFGFYFLTCSLCCYHCLF